MLMEEQFFQIGFVIVIAAVISFVIHYLRQPLIVAFIIAGILIGPTVSGLAYESEFLQTMSKIGVAFLLYTVGLGLNWRTIREIGGVALATGTGQVIFTTLLGYPLGLALGLQPVESLIISLAFAFSSTIVIVKLLADKKDIDRLYGRISVGFLIVQDIIAVFVLLVMNAWRNGGDLASIATVTIFKGIGALAILILVINYVFPKLVAYAAKSQELLLIFSIAWAFVASAVLYSVGFGIETGALLAGIALSGTDYHKEIESRIRPLRDFFLMIFFILLGSNLDLLTIGSIIKPAIIFSAFVIFGNPIVVMIIMRLLKHHPRTGFLTGTAIGQVSEFAFIILASAMSLGFVRSETISLATVVALITIISSSYVIKYNEEIFDRLLPFLRWLDPAINRRLKETRKKRIDALLIGYEPAGKMILPMLSRVYKKTSVVDFDPKVIEKLSHKKIDCVYGDGGDPDFLDNINASACKIIVSTVPNSVVSSDLLDYLASKKYSGIVVVSAKTNEDAMDGYKKGASFVIVQPVLSSVKFSEILKKNKTNIKAWKGSSVIVR